MCICGVDKCQPTCSLCPEHSHNDRATLIEGVSQRLMRVYANELICRYTQSYESAHFYSALRVGLHKDLDILKNIA